MGTTVRESRADGVATLTLDRPEARNALSGAMADELTAALAAIAADADVRAVVLRGAGGAFCAGGDLRDTAAAGPRSADAALAGMARYRRLAKALHDLDKPVVAAADGVAYGAGFSLLLLADIVLLSDRARLCMAFGRVGLVPDTAAAWTLPRAVGLQRAKALFFSARDIGAAEALAMGIALEVLPPDALDARADAIARSFTGASPTALALTKRLVNCSLDVDMDTLLALEASGQAVALSSSYVAEAARRFAAKEARQFTWPHAES